MKIFTPTVAYLGPEASFTHVAATALFGYIRIGTPADYSRLH